VKVPVLLPPAYTPRSVDSATVSDIGQVIRPGGGEESCGLFNGENSPPDHKVGEIPRTSKTASFRQTGFILDVSRTATFSIYRKSGEFRNKGTMRRFPCPYRPRIGFLHVEEENPG